jgi:hypothetical protein
VLHKLRAALGTARRQAGAPCWKTHLSLVTRNLPAGETAAGTGSVGRSALLDHGLRLTQQKGRPSRDGPDAKQAHLGECACLAPGDRLPVGDTTAGGSNTIGRGVGLPEVN